MKIQIASDLHLEFLQRVIPGEQIIVPAVDADILVLAGDIGNGEQAIELFREWPVPVLFIAGNHEFYGLDFEQTRTSLRTASLGTRITFLDNDIADFGGVRFLGSTLWTDYRLELGRTQRQLMENAEMRISDHFRIQDGEAKFSAQRALAEHEISRRWLEHELDTPYDGKSVVISHHGPHPLSVHPRYIGEALNAAFVSDLSGLVSKADFWIHGHVHDSFDYTVDGCRVIANPAGYVRNRSEATNVKELIFENRSFQFACVIDV